MTARLSGVAVVTGATGGIGRAVARALATEGMNLCLTGRDAGRLRECAREITTSTAQTLVHAADLSRDDGMRGLVERVRADLGRVDVLVHAAGTIRLGHIEAAGWDDLDEQYRLNLRVPFLLTRAFLPMLKASAGQIVFVNSTAALVAGADNALYAATKRALQSLAGSIRDHVNQYGVRVLSVYPGRTATPMQRAVHDFEGRPYEEADLVQPRDVAHVIVAVLTLPRTAEVTDVVLRPMKMPSSRRSAP